MCVQERPLSQHAAPHHRTQSSRFFLGARRRGEQPTSTRSQCHLTLGRQRRRQAAHRAVHARCPERGEGDAERFGTVTTNELGDLQRRSYRRGRRASSPAGIGSETTEHGSCGGAPPTRPWTSAHRLVSCVASGVHWWHAGTGVHSASVVRVYRESYGVSRVVRCVTNVCEGPDDAPPRDEPSGPDGHSVTKV